MSRHTDIENVVVALENITRLHQVQVILLSAIVEDLIWQRTQGPPAGRRPVKDLGQLKNALQSVVDLGDK